MRRYFPNLYGNENTKNRIGPAIESGRIPHAFLIDGGEGAGKLTLALSISAAMLCERKNDAASPLPCCSCNTCKRVLSKIHPDVRILEKQSDKATLGVREIREFREDMYLSPTEAESKIYIIRDAEKMTPEAQNALLIILEEPPVNTKIFLLASGCDRILTTIKSRSQYIACARFTPEEILDYLKKTGRFQLFDSYDGERLDALILSSDGRIGKALSIIESGELDDTEERRKDCISMLNIFAASTDAADILRTVGNLPDKRGELVPIFEMLQDALRDVIALKHTKNPPLLFFINTDQANSLASKIGAQRASKLFDLITRAHEECLKNANVPTLLATLCARIRGI